MAKAITLERAVWESFFWPEDVPRYMEASKDGTLEEVWARNVIGSPKREAVVTSEEAATYGSLEGAAIGLSAEFPEQCQYAILVDLRPVARLVAALAATKAGCVPIFLDGGPVDKSLSQVNLSNSKNIVIGDSELPIRSEKRVGSKRVEELAELGDASHPVVQQPAPVRRSGKVIIFSQDGAPVYLGETAQNNRLDSIAAFLSMKREPIIFYAGKPNAPLAESALGVALRLGGTVVLAETPESAAEIAARGNLRYDYGFLDPGRDGELGSLVDLSTLRRAFEGCSWMVCSDSDAATQTRLERTLHAPILGCLATPQTGMIISNHYSWNVHGSYGVPLPNAEAALQARTGAVLVTGQPGELIVSGPQIDRESAPRKPVTSSSWLKTGLSVEVDLNGLIHPFVQK